MSQDSGSEVSTITESFFNEKLPIQAKESSVYRRMV